MKEDRLHIQPSHLEEAKPARMPVGNTLTNHRLLTGATVEDTWSPPSSPCVCGVLHSFFLPVAPLQMLVFRRLQPCVCYRRPLSVRSRRVSARTAFVSYRQPAQLISPAFMRRIFLFFPLCLLSAIFYIPTVAHNNSTAGEFSCKVSSVFFFSAKRKQEGLIEQVMS